MYRYVWDGRVQAAGYGPYRYPPAAPELSHLRDAEIWPRINRKAAVTVYPPGAELAYRLIWGLWPDSVLAFKLAMALGDLVAAALLALLLRRLGEDPARVLVYAWSPLAVFELAGSAHVDGLVLPLLVGALLARSHRRSALTGLLLGAATLLKLYPALLLPALWRRDPRLPLAFAATLAAGYLPRLFGDANPLGYLPSYLGERFNGVVWLLEIARARPEVVAAAYLLASCLLLAGLAATGLWFLLRPDDSPRGYLRRGLIIVGWVTLLSQNLFPWYLLWALPFIAIALRPGPWLLAPTPAAAWWLFCGLVGLSYSFWLEARPSLPFLLAQYLPLYALLALPPLLARARGRLAAPASASLPASEAPGGAGAARGKGRPPGGDRR